jgi:hypothetical protein
MIERVRDVLTQVRRERARVSFAAVACRADVSRTFLYQHPDARKLVDDAVGATAEQRARARTEQVAELEASWRERALNAEDRLTAAYNEIAQQRTTIGELLGRLRDLEGDLPEGGIQRLITENTGSKKKINDLTAAAGTAPRRPRQQPLPRQPHRGTGSRADRATTDPRTAAGTSPIHTVNRS